MGTIYPPPIRPVNEDGFFAYREYNKTKSKGTRRVVVLGDSFTEGDGLNLSQNYVSRLDSLFNNTQVLNFGICGLNTRLERIRLETNAIKYDPDVVILQVLRNDLYDIEVLRYYGFKISRILDFTAFSSRIPGMYSMWVPIFSKVAKDLYNRYLEANEEEVTKRLFTQEIRKIKDLTFRENASLVLLSFQHTQLQKEAMGRLSQHEDVYFVNLPEETRYDMDERKWRLSEDDRHPSPFAHKVVARHISDRIGHLLK